MSNVVMKLDWFELLDGEIQVLGENLASNEEFDDFVFETINERVSFVAIEDRVDWFRVRRFIEIRNRRRF